MMLHLTLETVIQRWCVRAWTNQDTCLKLVYLQANVNIYVKQVPPTQQISCSVSENMAFCIKRQTAL